MECHRIPVLLKNLHRNWCLCCIDGGFPLQEVVYPADVCPGGARIPFVQD